MAKSLTPVRSCLICKKELTKNITTSFLLTSDFFEENSFVLDFITKSDQACKTSELDRICLSCFKNAETWHNSQQEENDGIITDVLDTYMDTDIKPEPFEIHNDPLQPAEGIDINKINLLETIDIPGYTRVVNNRLVCVVKDCNEKQDINAIRMTNRIEILANYGLYIPRRVKICEKHAQEKNWDKTLHKKCRKVYTNFSEEQIMDMLKLLKMRKCYFSDQPNDAENHRDNALVDDDDDDD